MSPTSVREPLLVRGLLVGVVTALVHVAVLLGWLSVAAVSPEAVAGVVDALGLLIAAFWARQAVTPAADPVVVTKVLTRLREPEPTYPEAPVDIRNPDAPADWEVELERGHLHP